MTKKYKGEKHAFLWTKKGVQRANFCGPGTQLDQRLEDGSKPVSQLDAICQKHDIAYSEATSYHDIQVADRLMLRRMDTLPFNPLQLPERKVIRGLMQTKMLGEKVGIFGPETFTEIPGLHLEEKNWQSRAQRKRKNLDAYLDNYY